MGSFAHFVDASLDESISPRIKCSRNDQHNLENIRNSDIMLFYEEDDNGNIKPLKSYDASNINFEHTEGDGECTRLQAASLEMDERYYIQFHDYRCNIQIVRLAKPDSFEINILPGEISKCILTDATNSVESDDETVERTKATTLFNLLHSRVMISFTAVLILTFIFPHLKRNN